MLRSALGPAIARYLEDPSIVEVMLNPDGRLWVLIIVINRPDVMNATNGPQISGRK